MTSSLKSTKPEWKAIQMASKTSLATLPERDLIAVNSDFEDAGIITDAVVGTEGQLNPECIYIQSKTVAEIEEERALKHKQEVYAASDKFLAEKNSLK